MAAFGLLPDDASFGGVMSWVGLAVGVTVGTGLAAMVWPNIEYLEHWNKRSGWIG